MENTLYYLGLFLIILIVKIAKLVKQYEPQELRKKWTEIFDVTLDMTFAASGCIIALLLNVDKQWIPVVYVVSVIILFISAFLELLSDKIKRVRPWINGVIIALIITGTIVLFQNVIPNVDNNGNKITNKDMDTCSYVVVIPYKDESIINHLGYSKIGEKMFYYSTTVKCTAKDDVIKYAIQNFNSDKSIKPIIIPKRITDTLNPIHIVREKITLCKTEE